MLAAAAAALLLAVTASAACTEYRMDGGVVTLEPTCETIGIVTQIDRPEGDPARAERWLRLAGCEKIFFVSAKEGTGLKELMDYLK